MTPSTHKQDSTQAKFSFPQEQKRHRTETKQHGARRLILLIFSLQKDTRTRKQAQKTTHSKENYPNIYLFFFPENGSKTKFSWTVGSPTV